MIVLEAGTTKVTLGEYENFYTRNSGGWDVAQKSSMEERERFLDLLTNYKLKLQDAFDRNLLNDSDIVSELKDYRSSLASTYMIERELTEPGIKKLYDRKKEEIRAKHILISVKAGASPEETSKAYTKAMDLVRRIKAGESFDSLAVQFSDDPSVKQNYGDIYYFTGGQMETSIEEATYSMRKGEISSVPSRSPFGYHIFKIIDRQPNRGSIKVRHIMARFQNPKPDSADSAGALQRILGLADSLKKGWDFGELAKKLSEDPGSASQGGDLGWFERKRFVLPFDESAFKLKAGEVSGIVHTPFGYHIMRCDSVRPLAAYTVLHDELKRLYQQNRYNDDYKAYIAAMKKEFHYSYDENVFDRFSSYLDTLKTTSDSAWDGEVPQDVRSSIMMMVSGHPYTVDTITILLGNRPEYRNTPLRKNELRNRVDRNAEMFLLQAKSLGLEDRSPDFASLMKEYRDGIVLYKAEQLEVWNKTTVSDSAMKSYYEQNMDKFMFPERVDISEIYLESDTLAFMVYDSLRQGADFVTLAARYNDDPDLKSSSGARGLLSMDTDEATQHAATLAIGEISEPIELEGGGFSIVKLLAREPARQKTYGEAGAEVSNAFQEYEAKRLEKEWLERVKEKHRVKQYKEVLRNAFVSPRPLR